MSPLANASKPDWINSAFGSIARTPLQGPQTQHVGTVLHPPHAAVIGSSAETVAHTRLALAVRTAQPRSPWVNMSARLSAEAARYREPVTPRSAALAIYTRWLRRTVLTGLFPGTSR
jgi:hypothetical protein